MDLNGTAFDVGLSLDLRIRKHFMVGAQVGYDVVTVAVGYQPALGGPVTWSLADRWLSCGLHAGMLFR